MTNIVSEKYVKKEGEREDIVNSAIILAKAILKVKDERGVIKRHVENLLGELIWKVTEWDGKWNCRYSTQNAINSRDGKINHEHVYTMKYIKEKLFENPEKCDDILRKIPVACNVTVEEHSKLSKVKGYRGWDRYSEADIEVKDRATDELLNLKKIGSWHESKINE